MKKKNKKGFTLIELLAVIVILAIIALIAVPQVLKILNKARLSAAEDTVYGIVKSAETYVSNFMLKNRGSIPSESLVFNCNNTGCLLENISNYDSYDLDGLEKLEFKGTKPKSGKVIISNNGNNITTTDLVINSFVCGYISGESICIEKGKIETKENGTVIYFNPETNEQCNDYVEANSDTNNKQGCMKWYIFNDSENSAFYNLLLDHNTTATIDNWNKRNTQLTSDTTGWNSSLKPRLITANEIARITHNDKFNASMWGTYFYFETLTTIAPNPYPSVSQYGWLYDRTTVNCSDNYGCLNNSEINGMEGYWTDTSLAEDGAWRVFGVGRMNPNNFNSTLNGIRPVINVPKIKFHK